MSVLIVGLGNPGKRYEYNRHNIGFLVLNTIVKRYNLEIVKKKLTFLLSILLFIIKLRKVLYFYSLKPI